MSFILWPKFLPSLNGLVRVLRIKRNTVGPKDGFHFSQQGYLNDLFASAISVKRFTHRDYRVLTHYCLSVDRTRKKL